MDLLLPCTKENLLLGMQSLREDHGHVEFFRIRVGKRRFVEVGFVL